MEATSIFVLHLASATSKDLLVCKHYVCVASLLTTTHLPTHPQPHAYRHTSTRSSCRPLPPSSHRPNHDNILDRMHHRCTPGRACNPKHQTRNPEPGTRNPEPGSLNPEPVLVYRWPNDHNSSRDRVRTWTTFPTRAPLFGVKNQSPVTYSIQGWSVG